MFKDVVGYEGLYQISEDGRVFSLISQKYIKSYDNGTGYRKVNLYKNGKCSKKYVHRLVAEAYLDNPNIFSEVNHIDSDRTNNNVNNLEWCNRSQNVKHTYDVGGRDSNRQVHLKNNYRGVEVKVVSEKETLIFKNMKEASIYFGRQEKFVSEKFRRSGKNKIIIDGKKVMRK